MPNRSSPQQAPADAGAARLAPRPFEGNYAVSLLTAILSMVPFIIVTAASALYAKDVSRDLNATATGLEIINYLSTAGYAFGALAGGDIIQRFPQRRLFLIDEAVFVLGAALAAAADGVVVYGAGRVLQGLATGLFLVTALPPVVQRFPSGRLPITAAAVNIGFFGATVVGPLLGGVAAQGHAWRWFYIALALLGGLTFLLAVLTLPDQEPTNPGARLDAPGLALGFAAAALPFWAVGELTGVSVASPLFAAPLGVGLVCLVAMLLVEYHQKEPLSPVKQMWHTFPIVGTLAAMVGGAAYFTFLVLAQELLLHVGHVPPLAVGLAFWPQVAAVILAAVLLGLLLRTRWLPALVLAGMILLMAGGGLLLVVRPGERSSAAMLSAAGLLGLGAGATVSPGLFMASLALPSRIIGRTFALVELVRSVADYILAPVMLKVAHAASGQGGLSAAGVREAIWVTLAVTVASALAGVVLFLLGGASLPRPDIEAWLKQNRPAIGSPKLAESVRERI